MSWVAVVWHADVTLIAGLGDGVEVRRALEAQGRYANPAQFELFVAGRGDRWPNPVSALGRRVWAWRVTEHVPRPSAEPCALAMVSLMRRHTALTHTEFVDHWTRNHAPLAQRRHAGLADYRQYVVDETLSAETPEIDGIAVLGFVTRADFDDRFFDSDAGRVEIMEDVARFMDRPGRETTLVGPADPPRSTSDAR